MFGGRRYVLEDTCSCTLYSFAYTHDFPLLSLVPSSQKNQQECPRKQKPSCEDCEPGNFPCPCSPQVASTFSDSLGFTADTLRVVPPTAWSWRAGVPKQLHFCALLPPFVFFSLKFSEELLRYLSSTTSIEERALLLLDHASGDHFTRVLCVVRSSNVCAMALQHRSKVIFA